MRLCIDSYRHSGKVGDMIDEHLEKIDVQGVEEQPIHVIGRGGQWFGNIEYMETTTLNSDFITMLHKIENSENISILVDEFKYINAELIWMLRSATKNGRLILIDKPANFLYSETIEAIERVSLYENSRTKLEEIEAGYKKLKKDDAENPAIEIMAKEIMRTRDSLQVLRSNASPKNFLGSSFIMGALNLLKGFEIEFFNKDLIIAKVTKNYSQNGITMKVIENLHKVIIESKKKAITDSNIAEFIFDNWTGSLEPKVIFNAPVESHDLWVLNTIDKLDPILNESSVEMIGIQPVAPMKDHITASMMASGTLGSTSQEVIVDNESYLMKSIMLPTEEISEVLINGEKVIEKTSIWKPQMGIFNLLRKEVSILED